MEKTIKILQIVSAKLNDIFQSEYTHVTTTQVKIQNLIEPLLMSHPSH